MGVIATEANDLWRKAWIERLHPQVVQVAVVRSRALELCQLPAVPAREV